MTNVSAATLGFRILIRISCQGSVNLPKKKELIERYGKSMYVRVTVKVLVVHSGSESMDAVVDLKTNVVV